MRLDYTLRPNTIRTNARFRGPTELDKYYNYVLESLHDITLLGRVLDNDRRNGIKGQSDFIKDNLAIYFSGRNQDIYATVPTASRLIGLQGTAVDVDLISSDWTAYGGCTKTATTLESDGSSSPSGVSYQMNVKEGDVLYVHMFAKILTGTADTFTIGSIDVNNGEGSTSTFTITPAGLWIGHYIACNHKEGISLNIDVAHTSASAAKVELSNVSIDYVTMHDYKLLPLNTGIKASVNALEQRIRNMINNV